MLVKISYTSGTHNKRNEKVIEISDKKSVAFCIIRVCISKLTFRSINKNIRKIKRNISNTIGRGVYSLDYTMHLSGTVSTIKLSKGCMERCGFQMQDKDM